MSSLPETICRTCGNNINGAIFGGKDEQGRPIWQHAARCCPTCPALSGIFNPTMTHADGCPRKGTSDQDL